MLACFFGGIFLAQFGMAPVFEPQRFFGSKFQFLPVYIGAMSSVPIGWLSDRMDGRRIVLTSAIDLQP